MILHTQKNTGQLKKKTEKEALVEAPRIFLSHLFQLNRL